MKLNEKLEEINQRVRDDWWAISLFLADPDSLAMRKFNCVFTSLQELIEKEISVFSNLTLLDFVDFIAVDYCTSLHYLEARMSQWPKFYFCGKCGGPIESTKGCLQCGNHELPLFGGPVVKIPHLQMMLDPKLVNLNTHRWKGPGRKVNLDLIRDSYIAENIIARAMD